MKDTLCLTIILLFSGLGLSLCYVSSTSCVALHFHGRRKLLALSFLTFASGVSALVYPVILEFLLSIYDWRGTLLVIAAISFNLCAFGIVNIPPNPDSQNVTNSLKSKPNNDKHNERRRSSISINAADIDIPSKSVLESFKAVLKHKPYVCYILSVAMSISSYNAILVFFIDYYETKGFVRSTAVWLYFATNLASCSFRFIPGILVQKATIPILTIPCSSLLLGVVTLATFPLAHTLTHFIVLACMFGISLGCLVSVLSITTMEITGQKYYSTALGITMTTSGVATAIAGPVSGKGYYGDHGSEVLLHSPRYHNDDFRCGHGYSGTGLR